MPLVLTNKGQEFIGAGVYVFDVPAGVESLWVKMTGAGGAGGGFTNTGFNRSGGAGGGSGEYCEEMHLACTPGGTVTVTVGAGAVATYITGDDGSASIVDSGLYSISCQGGQGGDVSGGGGTRGAGGGQRGGDYPGHTNRNGQDGDMGTAESTTHYGGSSGGGGVSNSVPNGHLGGPCEGNLGGIGGVRVLGYAGTYDAGGSGGAASCMGRGGDGGTQGPGENAPSYGAGGGGAGAQGSAGSVSHAGGNGGDGYVMLQWFESL